MIDLDILTVSADLSKRNCFNLDFSFSITSFSIWWYFSSLDLCWMRLHNFNLTLWLASVSGEVPQWLLIWALAAYSHWCRSRRLPTYLQVLACSFLEHLFLHLSPCLSAISTTLLASGLLIFSQTAQIFFNSNRKHPIRLSALVCVQFLRISRNLS